MLNDSEPLEVLRRLLQREEFGFQITGKGSEYILEESRRILELEEDAGYAVALYHVDEAIEAIQNAAL